MKVRIQNALAKFYAFLDRPILPKARLLLVVLTVPLALSFTAPLWEIHLEAPQYPKGLELEIYSYTIQGGNHGQHLQEINNLNHYIGMHKIDRQELSDLDWMPFALGALALLTLRCAAIGNVRSLVDLVVITSYVGAFAMGRFAYKMYMFGHHLDPAAPVKVAPFTPALFGTKQIANFTTRSGPLLGTLWIGVYLAGTLALLGFHLWWGRREAARAQARDDQAANGSEGTASHTAAAPQLSHS